MEDKTLFRVVHPPEHEHLRQLIEAAVTVEADQMKISNTTLVKFFIGKSLHRFLGVHFWVTWRMYDPSSNRFIDTGQQVCCFCPVGR